MKLFSSILASLLLASSAFAFSVQGEPELGFVGYKTAKKAPVQGKFKKFDFKSKESADFADFAKSIDLTIDTGSIDTKLPLRDKRISSIFSSAPVSAKITDVSGDDKSGTFKLEITANGVTKTYDAPYNVDNDTLTSKTSIDVLDFNLNETFAQFEKICKGVHSGKTWGEAEVNLKFKLQK